MSAALALEKLSVTLAGTPLLRAVDLVARAGEVTAIVGESGAGKTMLLRAILGFLPRAAERDGAVRLNGRDLTQVSATQMERIRGAEIGMVFQEPLAALNPVQTIGAQIAEGAIIHGRASPPAALDGARAAMAHVGLDPALAQRFPHEVSGGQRQRAAIAIATSLRPSVLLADEPTTALDVTTQAKILDLFRMLAHEDGAAVVLVTHDFAVVQAIADRVAVLQDGAVVDQADGPDLLARLTHPYARALAAAAHPRRRIARRAPGRTLLEVKDVAVRYAGRGAAAGAHALREVSFSVALGERVGIVGESGAGKSTLARVLLGLQRPDAGAVRIDGVDIAQARGAALRALRKRIQIVFQDPTSSFDPRMRVCDAIAAPLRALEPSLTSGERTARVHAMIARVGLSAADAARYPHAFSGGQRQRLALARALITQPDILVLDEAVSSLDPTIRTQMLDLISDIADAMALTTLFITHDLSVVEAVTDRVLVMRDGAIVEDAPVATLFKTPQHPYSAALIAAAPRLSPQE
jgi:peptide/nickel transport system ATP-binding protein